MICDKGITPHASDVDIGYPYLSDAAIVLLGFVMTLFGPARELVPQREAMCEEVSDP